MCQDLLWSLAWSLVTPEFPLSFNSFPNQNPKTLKACLPSAIPHLPTQKQKKIKEVKRTDQNLRLVTDHMGYSMFTSAIPHLPTQHTL